MGGDGKVTEKYGSDGAGTGDDIQGGGSEGAALWEQELVSDRGNYEGTVGGGVPPLGGLEDIRDVR